MRPARGSSISRRSLGAALGLAAVSSFTACGGGGGNSSDGVASLGTGDSTATETTVAADDQEAILAYTACLREQGLDVNDPTFDADGNMSGGFFGPESGVDRNSAEFQAAQTACASLIEGVTLGGGGGGNFDPEAMQEASLAFTECLREQGLDVGDLDLSARGGPGGGGGVGAGGSVPDGSTPAGSAPAGGGQGGGGGGAGNPNNRLAQLLGIDPEDPAVAAALEVCTPTLDAARNTAASTTVPS